MSANKNSTVADAQPPRLQRAKSFASLRCVFALMLREMATRYGRSPGGYIWALLEPLAGIAILAVGFSLVLRSPPLGNSFIMFYATGVLPFALYQKLSNNISRCIKFSKSLLLYPIVTWVDAALARLFLTTITELLVMIILLSALLQITDTRILLDFGPIMQSVALAILTGIGIGVLNCVLIGLFDAWAQIWSIITRPLFIVSGVIFLYDDLGPTAQNILWYNPLMHVTGLMRRGFYPSYRADYVDPTYVTTVALACLFFGVVLMGRFHRNILNK